MSLKQAVAWLLAHPPSPLLPASHTLNRPQELGNQVKAAKTQTRYKQQAVRKLETQLQRVKAEMKATLEVGTVGLVLALAGWGFRPFPCSPLHRANALLL